MISFNSNSYSKDDERLCVLKLAHRFKKYQTISIQQLRKPNIRPQPAIDYLRSEYFITGINRYVHWSSSYNQGGKDAFVVIGEGNKDYRSKIENKSIIPNRWIYSINSITYDEKTNLFTLLTTLWYGEFAIFTADAKMQSFTRVGFIEGSVDKFTLQDSELKYLLNGEFVNAFTLNGEYVFPLAFNDNCVVDMFTAKCIYITSNIYAKPLYIHVDEFRVYMLCFYIIIICSHELIIIEPSGIISRVKIEEDFCDEYDIFGVSQYGCDMLIYTKNQIITIHK